MQIALVHKAHTAPRCLGYYLHSVSSEVTNDKIAVDKEVVTKHRDVKYMEGADR